VIFGPSATLEFVRLTKGIRRLKVTDGGDLPPTLSQMESYDGQAARVRQVIENGGVPFCIGGGNDQSYANARGALDIPSMFVLPPLCSYVPC